MEMMERAKIKWRGRENRDGWHHRVILSNKSEIHFREGHTVRLGADYGWFVVDEASEVEKRLFKNLQARLRLPAAGKYLRGIVLSNPPHVNHWLHEVFGEEPGRFEKEVETTPGHFEITTFRFMQVSTRANPHNPPGYLADLLTGLTQAEIARLVEGGYGYIPDGPPVYPMFEHHRHIGMPELREFTPLVRAWDFGFRNPAVTFHQFWRCGKNEIHWDILDAVEGKMAEIDEFGQRILKYTAQVWPTLDPIMVEDVGDVSGVRKTETGQPGPIESLSSPPFDLHIGYKKCEMEPGLRMIREFLRLPQCGCGQSRFLVNRKARYVVEGFQGGYHLKRDIAGKAMKEDPMKDGFYDDFMDSVRYAAEHFLRMELIDAKLIETLEKTDPRRLYRGQGRDPWQRAMLKVIEGSGRHA